VSEQAELITYRLEAATPDGDALAAYLTMNDPARRNALSDALLDQLSASLQRAAADPRVRVTYLLVRSASRWPAI
jgi:enoyl-CoA hydratase/carnithine racemase